MTRIAPGLVLLLAITATISCDRITKHVAVGTLAGAASQSFLADTLQLEYAENAGAFLSLGASWPTGTRIAVFGVGNGVLLLALVADGRPASMAQARAPRRVPVRCRRRIPNLLDRIVYGTVIDFIHVGVGPLRTGIFNVADMAIMLGAALVVWAGCRADADDERP